MLCPYFEKNIEKHLKQNKNIILSAHGNTIRALGKKFLIYLTKVLIYLKYQQEIHLVIDFDNSGKFLNAKYLDESRKTKIISNE